MLEQTSTDAAPWFVVPADRKWYARLAVQNLVLEHLRRWTRSGRRPTSTSRQRSSASPSRELHGPDPVCR